MKDETIYIGISDEAKKIFDLIASEYSDKINKKLHFAILANLAEACVRIKYLYLQTNKKNLTVKSKNGETYVHPLQKLIKDERDEIARCTSKLGLDISTVEAVSTGRPLKGFKARMLAKK